jgi:hypothetical protein
VRPSKTQETEWFPQALATDPKSKESGLPPIDLFCRKGLNPASLTAMEQTFLSAEKNVAITADKNICPTDRINLPKPHKQTATTSQQTKITPPMLANRPASCQNSER